MRELEQKQKLKRRLYSTPTLIALVLLTVVLVRGATLVVMKKFVSSRHVEELTKQAETLAAREADIQSRIERLKTQEGMDEEIKKKFSVSKEGEHVAIIVDARNIATSTEEEKRGLLEDWWHTIKNLWHSN